MLKFLLSDNESLFQYSNGSYINIEDIKRRLLLKKRVQNFSIPDHLHRLEQSIIFEDIDSLSDLFTIAFPNFASTLLEFDDGLVYVKENQQNHFQEIITYLPPLWLQSLLLFKYTKDDIKGIDHANYFSDFILPNVRYTAIPSPRIIQLDNFIFEKKGLHDLHIHLNGALETDQVWQDYLFNPRDVYRSLQKGFNNQKVKEQLEQESVQLKPLNYFRLLKTAQKLRELFYAFLFPKDDDQTFSNSKVLLKKLIDEFSDIPGNYEHPFKSLIDNSFKKNQYSMSIEVLMHVLLLNHLEKKPNEILAGLLHFYLLILGLTNRLLVQQTHQNGFEQFQKNTLNELREESEKRYTRRYHQMHGNKLTHLHFIEGRFSPKNNKSSMVKLVDNIYEGWNKLINDIKIKHDDSKHTPKLILIAHFIKRAENRQDLTIRHKELRYDLIKKGKVLALLIKNHPNYKRKILGIDAAASEFDAAPEVFSPLFRMMRREGLKHFTYHAGEDFYHILDGLRAIYEAINFCDLRKGDRIGHATASGLCINLWSEVVGTDMRIKKGDHMDNLVFCYHLIIKQRITSLQHALPYITNEVHNLCFDLYGDHFPMKVLEKAWLLRQCCPAHAFATQREDVRFRPIYNEDEWNFMPEKFEEKRGLLKTDKSFEVYEKYHYQTNRKKFDEVIQINPFAILKKDEVEILQKKLLSFMSNKEIVIETLPTSNVRIGFHKDFSSYHLMNWVKWKKEGNDIPPIVVGTDDTGIFSTNIYNEYANIYCSFVNGQNTNISEAMNLLKELDQNSRFYRFD